MPGRRGKGRHYRSPARRNYLRWVVRRARSTGQQPREEDLEELARADDYARKKRQKRQGTGHWVTVRTLGLEPVIFFDREEGPSLQAAIARIEQRLAKGPEGTNVQDVLSRLNGLEQLRLKWAVEILKRLDSYGVELMRVRSVRILRRKDGTYVLAGVKNNGQTFGGEFAL